MLAGGRRQGRDQKSGRSVIVGRVHKQRSLPGPFVRSSACPAAHGSPNGPDPPGEGIHKRDRCIRRCASRYGAEVGRRWPADHCGEAVPAGLIDPAVRLKGEADVAECVECPRGGSDEPVREVVHSRRALAKCRAETGGDKRKRTAPAAGVRTQMCKPAEDVRIAAQLI